MPSPPGLIPSKRHVVAQWPTERPVVCCRFEPKGRFLFCGLESSVVQRFNLADGKRVSFPAAMSRGSSRWRSPPMGNRPSAGAATGGSRSGRPRRIAPQPIREDRSASGLDPRDERQPRRRCWPRAATIGSSRLWETLEWIARPRVQGARRAHLLAGVPPEREDAPERRPSGCDQRSGTSPRATSPGRSTPSPCTLTTVVSKSISAVFAGWPSRPTASSSRREVCTRPRTRWEPFTSRSRCCSTAESRKNVRTHLADGITGGVIWRLRLPGRRQPHGCVAEAATAGSLLFWKPDADKDYHRLALPNILRDMDLHPDGLRVATAHHDRHVRITRLAAKTG